MTDPIQHSAPIEVTDAQIDMACAAYDQMWGYRLMPERKEIRRLMQLVLADEMEGEA